MNKKVVYIWSVIFVSSMLFISCCSFSIRQYDNIAKKLQKMDEVASVELLKDYTMFVWLDINIKINLKNGGSLVINGLGTKGNTETSRLAVIGQIPLRSYAYIYKGSLNTITKKYSSLIYPHETIYISYLEKALDLDLSNIYKVIYNYNKILSYVSSLKFDQDYKLDNWNEIPESGFVSDEAGEYKLFRK